MTLVYRTVFSDADGRISAALAEEFEHWLESKGFHIPVGGLLPRGAPLDGDSEVMAWASATGAVLSSGDVLRRHRLIEETDTERWVTSVASVRAPSSKAARAQIWVDLEHEPTSAARLRRPGSPRIVRELMAAGEGYDGPVPLTAESMQVQRSHVQEVASYILSPARSLPIIVFTHDGQKTYDQEKLTRDLARDLAGVATVFRLVDADATAALALALPEGLAAYGGAMRTYLPNATGGPDDARRHRILGRTTLTALGSRAFPAVKDQILRIAVQRPAPAVIGTTGGGRSRPPSGRQGSELGAAWLAERITRIKRALDGRWDRPEHQASSSSAAEFDTVLDQLLNRTNGSPAERDNEIPDHTSRPTSESEIDRGERADDRVALEELLSEAQLRVDEKSMQVVELETVNGDLTLEATEASEDADRLARRVRWLERRIRDLGDPGVGTDSDLPAAPPSVAEVVVLARQHLKSVRLGEIETEAAALDLHAGAQLYAVKSWAALRALDAFARARREGRFDSSFFAWCSEPPTGEEAVSAANVAMIESETVATNRDLRDRRVFSVPSHVDPDGHTYMPAHIKIVRRGAPAPRLHFHDATAVDGLVYVGYLGAHLPTARFS